MVVEQQDLYALLQVPPGASPEEIEAAYRRLDELYSAERLQGSPPEFQELAARRREDLQAAFAVLHDPEQRGAYDRLSAAPPVAAVLDYRPLAPARRQERPSPSLPLPRIESGVRERGRRGRRSLVPPLLVGMVTLAMLLLIVLSGVRTYGGPTALATPAIPGLQLPYTAEQVRAARDRAEGSGDAAAWTALGTVLYDNTVMLREQAPLSPQYLGALPRWLDATQAYSRALELGAGPEVRSDLALSYYYYGVGANEPTFVERALVEAERALLDGPNNPRVLLNYGLVVAGLNPPRDDEARRAWRHLVASAPDSFEAARARTLLAAYGE